MSTKPSTKPQESLFSKRREPLGFMLWLGVIGSSLVFTSIFVVYLLKMNAENNYFVALPDMFWLSTLVILFSSITLHEANLAFVQERFLHYRVFLGSTAILGLTFMVLQVTGWLEMIESGIILHDNNSSGFVYLLTGLHLMHILAGIVLLGLLFRKAIKNRTYIDSFVYSVNPPNVLRLKLVTRYWHFVDALWLVVFIVLVILY
ncbi:MAG TPA: cytochrome c oxidase subunit 3 [Dyadobacter sp.]|jgi:cytochrome c oxidase subunit 3|nr:cytochrome c oxidase subunit 3 [Dyadobacter sp.]